jgi:enoyl-CoA hydratase
VAHLRLNRPEVLNAINPDLCGRLIDSIDEVEADPSLNAIVISGSGSRAFCSGADLATIKELTGMAKRRFIERAWTALDRLARSPVPSVAALHGFVLGGGLELAIACDLRIAEPGTTFGLPEITLGGVPAFGAIQRLPKLVGYGRALELALTGRRFDEKEAQALGLLTAVAEEGKVVEEALALAAKIASRPPEALRYLKLSFAAGVDGQTAAGLHGLISEACHRNPVYQCQISRFARTERRGPPKSKQNT